MTTTIADAYNNPFLIDGKTSPPARSAFAILGIERDDLDSKPIDQLLARSKATFEDDPDSAAVYGRPNSIEDLTAAADRLRDPRSVIVNEIIDFPFYRFDVSDLEELAEAVSDYKERVARYRVPKLEDPSIIGRLLIELLRPPAPPSLGALSSPPGDLPKTTELLADLA